MSIFLESRGDQIQWEEWEQFKGNENLDKVSLAIALLVLRGVNFSLHNQNYHIIIKDQEDNGRIDYWPSKDRWKDRYYHMQGYGGAFNLLRYIKK